MAKRKRENGNDVDENGRKKSDRGEASKRLIINAFVEMCKFTQAHGALLNCQRRGRLLVG